VVGTGFSQVWIELDGRAKRFTGLIGPVHVTQESPQVVLGHGELGLDRKSRAKGFGGFVVLSEALQSQAEVVARLGVLGLQAQGGPTAIDGLFMFPEPTVSLGEVGVKGGDAWTQSHGPADQLDGSCTVAALMMHDTEQMQGVGVLRLNGEQSMIAAGGIGIAAGLVELQSRG
jgi:hypothetical protein